MDEYLAMIKLFAGNYAPLYYAFCNGQTLSISQNAALFSLLGNTYGGNGQTTFQLPDLQGRVAIGQGQGAGLSNYVLGQKAGAEITTLTAAQMPMHTHSLNVATGAGTTSTPGTTVYLAQGPATGSGPNATLGKLFTATTPTTALGTQTIGAQGGSQPFSIRDPYLALNYVIVLQGTFPSRN